MFKRVLSFFEYVKWLASKNEELLKSKGSIFRIIKNEKNKLDQHILYVQVINKTAVFQCTAIEIAAENSLLECFSKNDVKVITYLATEEMLRPKSKIVSYGVNEKTRKAILKIKKSHDDEVKEYDIDKISQNKEVLKDLSQEDAHRVGYVCAIEELKKEQEYLDKLKGK